MIVDRSIEDVLVEQGVISREQLNHMLATRRDASESIGDMLIRHGIIDEEQRLRAWSSITGIPFIDIRKADLDEALCKRLSHASSAKHRALLIEASSTAASVAMINPLDLAAIDDISRELRLDIDPMWASPAELTERIVEIYGTYSDLDEILSLVSQGLDQDDVSLGETDDDTETDAGTVDELAEGGPIIQLVNALFSRAVKQKASDIHVEPRSDRIKVRFRIDGILRDIMEFPKEAHRAVVSRIKVVSGLDIAERRLPQDGRCTLQTSEGKLDFRVATYPTVHGEKITVRVLDKRGGPVDITKLGLTKDPFEKLLRSVDA
ncbi:MAG: ATPase, T2SS/T4P/T4SS family, partial [Armatimonadota bacterium]